MNIDMRGSLRSRPVRALLALVTVPLLAMACASAGRQGARSAAAGDWNTAVEYYQRALQDDPDRPEYRVALSRAMVNAARVHINAGRAFEAQEDLSSALREYRAASVYDPSNSEVAARAGRRVCRTSSISSATRPGSA